ncbi:MAG: exodeoxyribonuclease VII small subunit [Caldibacillus sp.]
MTKNKEELTFEKALEKLTKIVEILEEGDVPLEEAIRKYKEGMDLAQLCNKKLQNVEKELTQILKENGELASFTIGEEE